MCLFCDYFGIVSLSLNGPVDVVHQFFLSPLPSLNLGEVHDKIVVRLSFFQQLFKFKMVVYLNKKKWWCIYVFGFTDS